MCKQLIITNPWQTKINDKMLNVFKEIICANNNSDGFGLATTNVDSTAVEYLKYVKPVPGNAISSIISDVHQLPFVYGASSTFPQGKVHINKVLMVHGRFSTNDIGVEETHPIVSEDRGIALVHNGVVNSMAKYKTRTNNDSELILRAYEAGGIEEIIDNITGYYAFAIMDTIQDLLYIVRDDRANLFVSSVAWGEKGSKNMRTSLIFATMAGDIHALMKNPTTGTRLKYSAPVQMISNQIITFELSTGRWVDHMPFEKAIDKKHYNNITKHLSSSSYTDNVFNDVPTLIKTSATDTTEEQEDEQRYFSKSWNRFEDNDDDKFDI